MAAGALPDEHGRRRRLPHRRRSVGEEGLLQAAALAPVVETGESEDVWTRARPHCDGTGLCRAHRYGVVVHTRENL